MAAKKSRKPTNNSENATGCAMELPEHKYTEEQLHLKNRLLTSIADYTQAISFAPPDQLFITIVTKLKEITGAAEVLINEYDEEKSELVLRQITLSDEGNTKVRNILGRKLSGFRSPVSKDMYREMSASSIGRVKSLHDASFGAMPKAVGKVIEKMFGFGWFIGLALKHDDRLVGTILIAGKKGVAEPGDEELQAYAYVTANVLARRKAEVTLMENEERFRQLAENIDIVFWLTDWVEKKLLYVNPAYEKVFGMTVESAYADRLGWKKVVHPDDLDWAEKAFRENAVIGEYIVRDYRIIVNGVVRWIHERAFPLKDDGGTIVRYINVAEDITERKAAERLKQLLELRTATYLGLHEMADATEQELFDHCLEASMKITGSGLSFLGWMDRDETEMTIHAWSRTAMAQCNMDDKKFIFPIANSGLWGECVRQRKPIIVNDYSKNHKGKKGIPEGHVPLKNLLCVPISDRGAIVAVAAVANKDSDYTDDDAAALHVLINKMWEIHRRRIHEAEIDNLNSFLLSIRNLNQEIVKETDFDRLLATSCKILTEIRGYIDVSIAFADAETGEIRPRAHHGEHGKDPWRYSPECIGEVPPCILKIMGENSSVILDKEHGVYTDCGFCDHEEAHQSILVPMRNKNGELMGIISACLESGRAIHPQEVPLFEEVAGDLVFAYEKICNERALTKSEEKYRTLVETMQEGLWVIDENANTTFVNPAMSHMLGYMEEEMLGRPLFDFMDEQGVELAQRNLARRRMGIGESHEFEFIRKDGSRLYVQMATSPIMGKGGEYRGAIAGVQDITELKTLIDRNTESEQFIRTVMDNLPIGIAVSTVSPEVSFQYMNDNFPEIYGVTREKLADPNSFWEAVYADPVQRENIRKRVLEDMASGNPERMVWEDVEITTKTGVKRFISARNIPIPNRGLMISTVWDMTERHRLEDELKRHNDSLLETVNSISDELAEVHKDMVRRERLTVLGQMAASVSHELRNPLSVINNIAYYLRTKIPDPDEKTLKMLGILEGEVDRSDRIIGNMLTFSSRKPIIREPMSLNILLQEYFDGTDRVPGNVKLELRLSEDMTEITADSGKLKQVIDNLVSNACHAMPTGGKLAVSTAIDGDSVVLQVKDTGHGISQENLPRIFEPLYSTRTTGFGLGLAIVKTLVEDHGGKIEVESREGKGTRFTVTIPRFGGE